IPYMPPMAEVVKVTTKGQLTLPARIRRDLGISEDTYLLAEEVGDFVVLRRAETRLLELSESFQKEAKRKGITREALLRALKGARDLVVLGAVESVSILGPSQARRLITGVA